MWATQQTRKQQLYSNRRTVFSVQSVPRCYKQGKLGTAESWLVSELDNRWGSVVVELLLSAAGTLSQRPFGNPEAGERPPLKAATKQRLVKTVTD
jgi:hypothetical protein